MPCGGTQVTDQSSALATLNGQACTAIGAAVDLGAVSIGGGTPGVIPPGCYYSTGAINIGSVVHLNGAGVYVFRSAALGTASNSTVFLDNGACANNVFWAPSAATTLAANSKFSGTIIDNAGITIGANSLITGRLLATGGTITIDSDTITVPASCSAATAHLALAKTVSGGTATAGQFTLTATGDSSTGPTTISGTAPVTAVAAPAGVYTLSETGPTGYTPAYSCTGGGTLVGNKLTITSADVGNTITCTIANTSNGGLSANIGLVKILNNGTEGTATVGQFMLTATGNSATGPTVISGVSPVAATNAPPGVYTLTETGPTGYTSAYNCSGGGTLVGNRLTTTAADAGKTITCTITNTYSPGGATNLGLLKTVTGGTATAGQFTLTATGDSTTGPTVITGTTPVAASNAPVGIYALTETGPTGYTAAYSCTGGGTLVGNKLTITSADADKTITCTVTNTYTSTTGAVGLGLLTSVVNTGGGTATTSDFMVTATGDSTTGPMVITGISPVAAAIAPLGVYALTETGPIGYTATYSCNGGTLVGNKLTISSADSGSVISCTIINTWTTDANQVKLGLLKTVSNTGGGTATVGQFILTATGDSSTGSMVITGTTPVTATNAPVGVYTLTEAGPAGYTASYSCSGGGALSGNKLIITSADAGKTITCTIANTYNPSTAVKLGLLNTVSNTGGGAATVGQFTLTATGDSSTGPMVITGTTPVAATNAPVGVYALTETGPTGYTAAYSCSGGGTLVGNKLTITSADAGKTISCTIANTWTPTGAVGLALLKSVVNTGGGTATTSKFTLTATGDSSTGPMVITGISPVAAAIAPLGVYALTETGPTGYTPSYSCSGGGTLSGNKLTITSADAGSVISCTIINTWTSNSTGVKLGLVKSVVNTGGGTATAGQFILTATGDSSTGPMVITGTSPVPASNAPVGVYTLTETGPTGYTASYSCTGGGTLSSNKLTITSADAGKTITCTISNLWTTAGKVVLAISKTGTGSGTVTSSDSKISCGGTCSASYTPPISTTLTATPASGSTFAGWSGGSCSGTGTCAVSSSTGVTISANFISGGIIKGDFYGEGVAGILWRNYSTGENGMWDNATHTWVSADPGSQLPVVTDPNWEIVGVGNFGSGVETDMLWRHKTYGYNVVWHLSAGTVTSEEWLPTVSDTNWSIVATANFSGTGYTDILWRSAAGENVVWHMNGLTLQTATSLPTLSDTNWMIVGTGDFKGDNSTTIIWRHKQYGYNAYWYMSGPTITAIGLLPSVTDVNWEIVGVADYNGDGKPDILWRHKIYGYNVIWFMNGISVTNIAELAVIADTNWKIVGTK
ncbi:MAG: hypothetical protein HQK99_13090 [Nitrospirae bacterium]|nr:hypothetical protein [Nitrospirota bacterium]